MTANAMHGDREEVSAAEWTTTQQARSGKKCRALEKASEREASDNPAFPQIQRR